MYIHKTGFPSFWFLRVDSTAKIVWNARETIAIQITKGSTIIVKMQIVHSIQLYLYIGKGETVDEPMEDPPSPSYSPPVVYPPSSFKFINRIRVIFVLWVFGRVV